MDANADLDTPMKLARRSYWPRGPKRGGKVSERAILYALRQDDDSPSPALDLIEAVAMALRRQPWELLTDSRQARRAILEQLMNGGAIPDAALKGGPFDASRKIKTPEDD